MEARRATVREGRVWFATRRSFPVPRRSRTESEKGASTELVRQRVLVIEDNVDMADTLREMLEQAGHEVVLAHTGVDGVRKASALRPDIILCDIGLPGISGYEVSRLLREDDSLRATYLVALTGYAAPDDVVRAVEAGFDCHLAKPFNPEVVMQMVTGAANPRDACGSGKFRARPRGKRLR
jgi:CheY-like chemotaxis protein